MKYLSLILLFVGCGESPKIDPTPRQVLPGVYSVYVAYGDKEDVTELVKLLCPNGGVYGGGSYPDYRFLIRCYEK